MADQEDHPPLTVTIESMIDVLIIERAETMAIAGVAAPAVAAAGIDFLLRLWLVTRAKRHQDREIGRDTVP